MLLFNVYFVKDFHVRFLSHQTAIASLLSNAGASSTLSCLNRAFTKRTTFLECHLVDFLAFLCNNHILFIDFLFDFSCL
jgi:hypothetical protein